MRGFFITGTDTEIGKTLVTSLLTLGLQRQGIDCCPAKPVATGGVDMDGQLLAEDVQTYARFAEISEPLHSLNPVCLRKPASPHFAAQLEQKTIEPDAIVSDLNELQTKTSYLLVEGIGGWLVPITPNYLVADLAGDLDLPVILVVANKLGAINHTLLTLEAIRTYDEELLGVIITHPSSDGDPDIEQNNIETIRTMGNVDILGTIPHLDESLLHEDQQDALWNTIRECIQWNTLIERLRNQ